jgi:hypothetical protein
MINLSSLILLNQPSYFIVIQKQLWNLLRLTTQDMTQYMVGYHQIEVMPSEANGSAFIYVVCKISETVGFSDLELFRRIAKEVYI